MGFTSPQSFFFHFIPIGNGARGGAGTQRAELLHTVPRRRPSPPGETQILAFSRRKRSTFRAAEMRVWPRHNVSRFYCSQGFCIRHL